jgi:hypothetical protein
MGSAVGKVVVTEVMRSTKGKFRRASRKSASAPSRSCTLAEWTLTASSKPSVSVRMWRLRPLDRRRGALVTSANALPRKVGM